MDTGTVDVSAGASAAPALAFRGVTFRYRPGLSPALTNLNLEVGRGEILAVVGGNGSGKSTLAKLANGLLQPQSGEVLVGGLSTLDSTRLWEVRAQVGLLFQDPEDQIVGTSVEDDVAFGLENLGVPREEMRARVAAILEAVGLAAEARTEPHLLSAGQKQRLALAAVLVLEPSVLVLDEPTSMLDSLGRTEALRLVRDLASHGVAVVLITQHMAETLEAGRLLALDRGFAVFDGEPAEFFLSGAHCSLPLGEPPALFLARELAERFPADVSWAAVPLTEEELVSALGGFGLTAGFCGHDGAPGVLDQGRGKARTRSRPQEAGTERTEAKRPGEGNATTEAGQERVQARLGKRAGMPSSATATPPAGKLSGVGVIYDRGMPFAREALRGIDLVLDAGVATAVVGATAAGKSTLLQVLAGLIAPTAGRIVILGRNGDPPPGSVGMVFQRPEIQLFAASVEEDVGAAPRMQGMRGGALKQRVALALRAVGLDPAEFAGRSPHALSLGEQRRVALAGILALDPALLILDEPGVGLDPLGRRRMMCLLHRWVRGSLGSFEHPGWESAGLSRGIGSGARTLVFSSHDLDEVARWADRVVMISQGRVVDSGTVTEVLGRPEALRAAGLEPPLAVRVAASLAAATGRETGVLLPIDIENLAAWLAGTEGPFNSDFADFAAEEELA